MPASLARTAGKSIGQRLVKQRLDMADAFSCQLKRNKPHDGADHNIDDPLGSGGTQSRRQPGG
nr:putative protein [uncultured bacterium]